MAKVTEGLLQKCLHSPKFLPFNINQASVLDQILLFVWSEA